jgi:predicted  nucleic acid-binding Zn-ribbon protein
MISSASRRHSSTQAAGARLDAAESKIQGLQQDLADLEQELVAEVQTITDKWNAVAQEISTASVPLERTDVKVVQRALVWLPVP